MRLGKPRAVAVFLCFAAGTLSFSPLAAPELDAIPDASADALITPAWTPYSVGISTAVVMVKLSGNPVALQQAAAGRKLSGAEKQAIKEQLRSQQASIVAAAEALGGQVLGTYQSAFNGVKVLISRDKVQDLAALAGVVSVRPVIPHERGNVRTNNLIGSPTVWQNLGVHGEGVKVAIIDTGVDYTHANFGGPGTAAAYTAANAAETAPADPAHFGPGAPRVKGGFDFAGNAYNAGGTAAQRIPHPDPNPLDCNGHGSHVAGTAAGSGVTAAGTTYTGTYDTSTLAPGAFSIGPGVAPKADIYAVRVFGCTGSTQLTVDGIEWAVDNEMDVINMSLGSSFGSKDDSSAEAATNAAKAGVIVVVSAGNSGPQQYIVGSPGTGDGSLTTAASDANEFTPGAKILLPSGTPNPITAVNANEFALAPTAQYTIRVIQNNPATPQDESLGCSVADFGGPLPPNTIAVVNRGVCARVAKAIFGQQAGAAAVVMVNNAAALPPVEGPITVNPDDGVPFTVTIPFLGVAGGTPIPAGSDGGRLRAANGFLTTVTPFNIPNAAFKAFASFSSAGPRKEDSTLKPEITAPGVAVISTAVGTGNGRASLSGTSMASPAVAGVAALARQVKPTWSVEDIKAAIVNTGAPSLVTNHRISRGGTGLVQPVAATQTQVVARANSEKLLVALSFGFEELKGDFSKTKEILLENNGDTAATFNISTQQNTGFTRPHTVAMGATSVTVPAHGKVGVPITVTVPSATVPTAALPQNAYTEVAGFATFTPASPADNAGVTLRVPYHLAARTVADVATRLGRFSGTNPTADAVITNKTTVANATADFYAWGLDDPRDMGNTGVDLRAVGVQSFPLASLPATARVMLFAVNTYEKWSHVSTNEFDIYVDVDGDGVDDYIVVGVDAGLLTSGVFNGTFGSFVFSTRSAGATQLFNATAGTNQSTVLLPVSTTQFCRAPSAGPNGTTIVEPCLSQASNPRISYRAVAFDLFTGTGDATATRAAYNVWSPAITQGVIVGIAAGGTATVPITINSAEWAITPSRGIMVVSPENQAGPSEAQLIAPDFR